jgi:hypothetical protein
MRSEGWPVYATGLRRRGSNADVDEHTAVGSIGAADDIPGAGRVGNTGQV